MTAEDKTMWLGLGALVLGTFVLIKLNHKKGSKDEAKNVMIQECVNAAKNNGVAPEVYDQYMIDCISKLEAADKEA